jgi:putative peptide zinc metalloprotease protein
MTRSRILALLAALVLGASAGALPALADEGNGSSGDNAAVAVNTKDGSSLFDFAFDIVRVTDSVIDNENVAVAYASCEECRTVAIAVQIVLVSGSPDTVTPTNLAVALNENCTSCQTMAAAYQFVFGTGEDLRFTREGWQEIMRIRKEFKELGDLELGDEEIKTRADALAGDLREVLATEVTTKGREGRDADQDDGVELEAGDDRAREEADPVMTTPVEPEQPAETQPAETPPPAETQPTTPTETQPTTQPPAETTPAETTPTETQPPAETQPTETQP